MRCFTLVWQYKYQHYTPTKSQSRGAVEELTAVLRPMVPVAYKERVTSLSSDEYAEIKHYHREAASQKCTRRKSDSNSETIIDIITSSQSSEQDSDDQNLVISPSMYPVPEIYEPTNDGSSDVQFQVENDMPHNESATQHADVSSSDTSLEEENLQPDKLQIFYHMRAKRRKLNIDEHLQLKLSQMKRRTEAEISEIKRRSEAEVREKQRKLKEMEEIAILEATIKKRKICEKYEMQCIIKNISDPNIPM